MKTNTFALAATVVAAMLAPAVHSAAADDDHVGNGKIKHVLLLSIDGMHAADFYNCAHGVHPAPR